MGSVCPEVTNAVVNELIFAPLVANYCILLGARTLIAAYTLTRKRGRNKIERARERERQRVREAK